MLKLEARPQPSRLMALCSPLIALAVTVLLGVGLFMLLGKEPVRGLQMFFWEPIRSAYAWSELGLKATPLILIGNGTGLAGLLAHARHRHVTGGGPVWLFWGERHPAQDDYHAAERAALRDSNTLTAEHVAWSRLGSGPRYVQDALTAQAGIIAQAVADGAAIYVCGSLQGMASDVHNALASILGETCLEMLLETGRYRRDIY